MSKLVSSSARRALLLLFWLAVSGLVLAAIFKAVRQHAGVAKTATPRATSAPQPLPPVVSAVPTAPPPPPPLLDESPDNIPAQREVLLKNMQSQLGLEGEALAKTRAIFEGSRWLGQGNPKITKHPMTRAECLAIHRAQAFRPADARCAAPNMVLAFNPTAGETKDSAKLCIDQFEYPNIACDYPVTWVKSDEAENLCKAQGKRLCDAHEWEGACAGAVLPPEHEYTFGERRLQQEYLHNKDREVLWAYGKQKNHKLCATGSGK